MVKNHGKMVIITGEPWLLYNYGFFLLCFISGFKPEFFKKMGAPWRNQGWLEPDLVQANRRRVSISLEFHLIYGDLW